MRLGLDDHNQNLDVLSASSLTSRPDMDSQKVAAIHLYVLVELNFVKSVRSGPEQIPLGQRCSLSKMQPLVQILGG
jgi:hypothetical protein